MADVDEPVLLTLFNTKKVSIAPMGAAAEKASRCLLIRLLSRPSWRRNETRPNAAGA